MLYDPNVLYLGTDASNTLAQIRIVDGNVTPLDDPDAIDPTTFTELWRVDVTDEFRFDRDGATALTLRNDRDVRVHNDLHVDNRLVGLELGSTTTRIPEAAFDTGIHSIRQTSGDSDRILDIERHGTNDYDLHLRQSGSFERVFTTADDGDFDASTLDGRASSAYAELDQDESVTGSYTFSADQTFTGTVNADTIDPGTQLDVLGDLDAASITEASEPVATESHVDDVLVDIYNDGQLVSASVAEIDFGVDIGATQTAEGVEVEYVGATIPSDVYEDGQFVVDANGLDFIGDFNVSIGVDDIAEIELDVPDDLASTTSIESVTADWNFTADLTHNGDTVATLPYVDANFFSGSYTDLTDVPGTFEPENHGDARHTENYAAVDRAETLTGAWTLGADLDVASQRLTFDGLWRQRYSSAMQALVFEQDGQVGLRLNDDRSVAIPEGISGGLDVADSLTVGGTASANSMRTTDDWASYDWAPGGSTEWSLQLSDSSWEGISVGDLYLWSYPLSDATAVFKSDGQVDIPEGGLGVGGGLDVGGGLEVSGSGWFEDWGHFGSNLDVDGDLSVNGTVDYNGDMETVRFVIDGDDHGIADVETGESVVVDINPPRDLGSATIRSYFVGGSHSWTSSGGYAHVHAVTGFGTRYSQNFGTYTDIVSSDRSYHDHAFVGDEYEDDQATQRLRFSNEASDSWSSWRLVVECTFNRATGWSQWEVEDAFIDSATPDSHESTSFFDGFEVRGERGGTVNLETNLDVSGAANIGDSDGDLSVNNRTVVVGDNTYEIQKNGTDGPGIINFKTQ